MTSVLPNCPICKQTETRLWSVAKDYEYSSSEKNYSYYQCQACDTLFIHPVPLEELKLIYPPTYYSFSGTQKNWVFRVKETMDKRLLKKILKQVDCDNIKVLDVGGGTGWLLDIAKSADDRVKFTEVVDIDNKPRAEAESKGHQYFEGRVEDFKPQHSFHLVLMLNLIEHVSNPLHVLQMAEKLMEPGGILLLKTPNNLSWDARLFKNTYWGGLHCPRHWVIFSEKSFRHIIKDTGFSIRSLQYTQGAPFWAFSIIALLARKKLVRVNYERPIIYHPLFPLLSAFFALFDFIRSPFSKTSQMFITLQKSK